MLAEPPLAACCPVRLPTTGRPPTGGEPTGGRVSACGDPAAATGRATAAAAAAVEAIRRPAWLICVSHFRVDCAVRGGWLGPRVPTGWAVGPDDARPPLGDRRRGLRSAASASLGITSRARLGCGPAE